MSDKKSVESRYVFLHLVFHIVLDVLCEEENR